MADHVIHTAEAEAASNFAGARACRRGIRDRERQVAGSRDPCASPTAPHHLRVHRSCPRTRRRSWMPTSPRTWKRPWRAIANRSNHPHGIDPRFQRSDQGRARGAECAANAHGHLPHSGKYRHRHLRDHADRVGPRRGTCRHSGTSSSRNCSWPCPFIRSLASRRPALACLAGAIACV
jgi:hypothetical protein